MKVNKKVLVPLAVGIIIGFFLMFFLIRNSSLIEVTATPIGVINPVTQEVEKEILLKNPRYTNNDLDAIFDEKIENNVLTFELKSHPSVEYVKKVGAGNSVVMWYEINSVYQLENALGTPEFTDMRTGEKIEREWRYVYLAQEEYEVPVHSCEEKLSVNGSTYNDCRQIGTETKTRSVWKSYDSKNISKGKITIGIEVKVREDDYVDGVWSIGGLKIDKHAAWTEDLNSELMAYYAFDETSGTIAENSANTSIHNLTLATDNWVNGKINNAFRPAGAENVLSDLSDAGFTGMTINFWINQTATISNYRDIVRNGNINGAGEWNILFYNDNTFVAQTFDMGAVSTSLTLGQWEMMTITFNTTSMYVYKNGAYLNKQTGTFAFTGGDHNIRYFSDVSGSQKLDKADVDEWGVWNRTLTDSEITQLYNDGDGIIYGEINDLAVTLNAPEDNYKSNLSSVTFNCSATDETAILNLTLIIDDVDNETITNSTADQLGLSIETAKSLSEGSHNWTCRASDGTGLAEPVTASARNVTTDTISPVLNISHPNETLTFHKFNTNLTLNYTVSDANIQACWYIYNGVRYDITCGTNSSFNVTSTVKNLTLYANDSSGNEAHQIAFWNYRLLYMSKSFESSVLEGTSTNFTINLLTNGSDITLANLNYDSTDYAGTITDNGGNNFTILKTVISPSVTTNSNISFFWNISQGNLNYIFDSENQTVVNFLIDDCTTNSIIIYNFTVVDEKTQNKLSGTADNTQSKVDLQIYRHGTSTQIEQFNKTYSQKNSFAVCINSSLSTGKQYNLDAVIEYSATGHQTEFYHVQGAVLNLTKLNQNITLYDLNSSNAQIFKLIVKDSSFLALKDALVEVYRKYIDEGVYKIVEIPKTDARGETIGNLVVDEVIYKFIIKRNGVIIDTFSDVRAICQNPTITTCAIDFNSFATGVTVPDYTSTSEDFNFTLAYNSTSKEISSQFLIPSGEVSTVTLEVIREDALGTAVCSDSLTGISGALSCEIPSSFGNATVLAKISKGGVLQGQGNIRLGQTPSEIYGGVVVFLAMFVMVTLIGVGLSGNPVFTVIFLMIGVTVLVALNLVANNAYIGATATILWLFVALVIILIKGARRN